MKIEILIDGEHDKSLTLTAPDTIDGILGDKLIKERKIIGVQINNEYYGFSTLIEDDVCLNCITILSPEGHLIYQDTTIFILMKAFNNLFPHESRLVAEHSVGDGIFCEVFDGNVLNANDIELLKAEMKRIIKQAIPIEKRTVSAFQAEEIFTLLHRDDVVKNLVSRNVEILQCGKYIDYYLRQLADNTSFITAFDIIFHSPGLILRFPRRGKFNIIDKFILPRTLFATHQEHDKWLNILKIHNVSALNRAIRSYEITDLIQIEEALHEKKVVDIANKISWNKHVKVVLIAGPSSSGKTTFAKRLSIQLRVNGIVPHVIGMDDYFKPRRETPRLLNGMRDYEGIEAVDTALLNEHLQILMQEGEIEIPKYDFISGEPEKSYRKLKLEESNIIILEGIHGLNDKLTESIPFNQKIKVYVSALNNLNIDAHNRIRTSDSRKIRRIVRDHKFRGHTAEQTLLMWDLVREGENKNIFPFQENADYMFNSILTYELGVLKKYCEPLLRSISRYSRAYSQAAGLLRLFTLIDNIDDDLVPTDSIIREFIGGSVFKY